MVIVHVAQFYTYKLASIISGDDINVPKESLTSSSVENVMKAVFGIAGGIAVIVILLGGLKYINSLGNAQNVAKAKDTILYAVIGLVVCILGYSIVGFIVERTAG